MQVKDYFYYGYMKQPFHGIPCLFRKTSDCIFGHAYLLALPFQSHKSNISLHKRAVVLYEQKSRL